MSVYDEELERHLILFKHVFFWVQLSIIVLAFDRSFRITSQVIEWLGTLCRNGA